MRETWYIIYASSFCIKVTTTLTLAQNDEAYIDIAF